MACLEWLFVNDVLSIVRESLKRIPSLNATMSKSQLLLEYFEPAIVPNRASTTFHSSMTDEHVSVS